ncbi:MAG: hypothetical protein R3B68_12160 [Phycisphaerales bacterium]
MLAPWYALPANTSCTLRLLTARATRLHCSASTTGPKRASTSTP